MSSILSVKSLFYCVFLLLVSPMAWAQNHNLSSPDGNLKITIHTEDVIHFSVTYKDDIVIEKVSVSMSLNEGRVLGEKTKVKSVELTNKNEIFEPQIPHKDASIISEFNELNIHFKDKYTLSFRAYDEGFSYRFIDKGRKTTEVISEKMQVDFPEGVSSFFPKEESMYSHNERVYLNKALKDLAKGDFCSLPVMFDHKGVKVLITEASLHDYPGMFLNISGENSLEAKFPKYVLKAIPNEKDAPDRNQILEKEADYIAKVSGPRSYPWRVFMISDDDRSFVASNLVTKLSGKSNIVDASWIKPGKVAWDWYNANNVYGVDFEAGINTETYKYYIDFASENNIEYVILDEGWTKSTTEIMESHADIDLAEIISYGKEKNVGIILWVLWKPLDENMDAILKLYADWGAKGIKVDFMQRSDQYMVSSYETIAKKAADLKLLVDYHGAFKPAGIERVWPNIVNYEGVKGNENNKWSADITPEHNVTIPFIRMAAGPLDFTPGAMVNAHPENYAISFLRPMSMGTRSHQLAMYVVYEAPLQMLCESPTIYKKEQESVNFIRDIPTVWDETIVIEAQVADYLLLARRKGSKWYVGGMTDATARDFTLSLDFLGAGSYTLELMKDGENASRHAEDYKYEMMEVDKNSSVPIRMVGGGGWVAKISKTD